MPVFSGLPAFDAGPFTDLGTSPKRRYPDSNRDTPLQDYSRFSKPLPYQLGLYRLKRRRQDSNLHDLSVCLFSRQVLHQLSDCGRKRCALESNPDSVDYTTCTASNRVLYQLSQRSISTSCGARTRIMTLKGSYPDPVRRRTHTSGPGWTRTTGVSLWGFYRPLSSPLDY